MSVCFAIQLGLTSQLRGLLYIPLANPHESYQWKTRLKRKREGVEWSGGVQKVAVTRVMALRRKSVTGER